MNKIIFSVVYAFFWLLSLLPFAILYKIADVVFFFVFHVFKYRRKLVVRNLKNSFPEKNNIEIKHIEKEFYAHLCDYFFETIKMLNVSQKEIKKRAKYLNLEILEPYISNNRSVIIYLGHYGNWEWLSLSKHAHEPEKETMIYPVYHKLSNQAFDKLFRKLRTNIISVPIPQEKILRTMLTEERKKKAAIYIFIADQSTTWRNIHYWTKFLNQDTATITGAERIAKQTNYPSFYIDVKRVKRGHYTCELIELSNNPKEMQEFELTEKYMRMLETTIQQAPAYWLWTHNRWRHKKQ